MSQAPPDTLIPPLPGASLGSAAAHIAQLTGAVVLDLAAAFQRTLITSIQAGETPAQFGNRFDRVLLARPVRGHHG